MEKREMKRATKPPAPFHTQPFGGKKEKKKGEKQAGKYSSTYLAFTKYKK